VNDGYGGPRDGQADPGRTHVRFRRVSGGRRDRDPRHDAGPLDPPAKSTPPHQKTCQKSAARKSSVTAHFNGLAEGTAAHRATWPTQVSANLLAVDRGSAGRLQCLKLPRIVLICRADPGVTDDGHLSATLSQVTFASSNLLISFARPFLGASTDGRRGRDQSARGNCDPVHLCASKDSVDGMLSMIKQRGSIMPAIFDLLYREYCRSRLAEMRKQLLLWPVRHEVLEADCDADHADDTADRARGFDDTPNAVDHSWPI
jgi:hypothetical protein